MTIDAYPLQEPVTIVTGAGRCGSTLVMDMLNVAGLPCVGDPVSWEDDRASVLGDGLAWLTECSGAAVKVLDLHRFPQLPNMNYRAIWLRRDERQQALSQLKLLGDVLRRTPTNADVAKVARSIRHDYSAIKRRLHFDMRADVLVVKFEDLLDCPRAVATSVASFVGCGEKAQGMAALVMERPHECAPDLSMEVSRLNRARADALAEVGV